MQYRLLPSPLRRDVLAGLAATMLAALAVVAPPAAAEPVKLTFLHVNDLDRMGEVDGRGGLARLAAVIAREKEAAPGAVFTHGGDAISPSLLSGFDKGAHMIDLLNAAGVQVMTLGNHEFDFGPDAAVARIAEAKFPIVSANVLRDGKPLPGTQVSRILDVEGYKVGFYGLTTPASVQLSSTGDVEFRPLLEAARAAAGSLRDQGADLIVAIAHTAIDEDLELVRSGVADVILGGHDHLLMNYYDGKSILLESASQAEYVSVLDLTVDRVKGRDGKETIVWTPEVRTVSTADVEPDPAMQAKVQAYEERLGKELDMPVGKVATALDSRRATVRGGEAAIGNLIADAIRQGVGADLAITNGGGIRADRTYEAGTILTRRDVQSELPFGNRTVKLELTGAQVVAALENGVSQVREMAGRFPQVSGLRFSYDPQADPGHRVSKVEVAGRPIDPDATYSVATNDFMADGGDGYVVFREGRMLIDPNAAQIMASQVIDYVRREGTVAPEVEGRITPLR